MRDSARRQDGADGGAIAARDGTGCHLRLIRSPHLPAWSDVAAQEVRPPELVCDEESGDSDFTVGIW
jgi:hypothetical protein